MTKPMLKALKTSEEFLAELGGSRLTFRLRGDVTVIGVIDDYRRGFIRLSDVTITGIGEQPLSRPIAIVDRSAVQLIY